MIVSVTPSRHEFLLALWNFPCLCCWCLISALLRTFHFFFLDRTLAANASLCLCTGAVSPLKLELKKTHVDDGWLMCRAIAKWQSQRACNISSAPLRSDGLERRISGKAPRPRGGFTCKHDRRGPNGQLPCILDRQRLPRTLRDHVESASALSALKKSLVASLSAKRQLSVAKLSAKRIFYSPNGIF